MWIEDEIPAKLRFGYLLYYSLSNVIEEINEKMGTHFDINQDMKSDAFRNAMAHYKLGVVLKENELMADDLMFGLTRKLLGKEYCDVKNEIYAALDRLARQIGEYLNLPQGMVFLYK